MMEAEKAPFCSLHAGDPGRLLVAFDQILMAQEPGALVV